MATVVLLGTLDTKGAEYEFVRAIVEAQGCDTLLVDAGVTGQSRIRAHVTADEVAAAAGANRASLASGGDRGVAVSTMATGSAAVVARLHGEGKLDALMGLGGSGGSSIVASAMHGLPIGVPKLLVSTMASGDVGPYVGTSDVTLMYSVVDIAGVNRVSERILTNAAMAISAMARGYAMPRAARDDRPLVGATMFGVTTPSVNVAREYLEERGYEVLVFHATGAGGRAMEALIAAGFITAALDITTTELADEHVGGVLSAGPDRLEAAGRLGIPQVVSLGALDMVNFGPMNTVPERFKDRLLYVHNSAVTLMRTTGDECEALGTTIADKLNRARGAVTVFIPMQGFSMIDVDGGPFHDPDADRRLISALVGNLRSDIEIVQLDVDINEPSFAKAMAQRLDESYATWERDRRANTPEVVN